MSINVDELAASIVKSLDGYTTKIIDGINEERIKAAKKGVKELKVSSPRKKGNYAKGWGQSTEKFVGQNNLTTIHNKKHYPLTHLLENGHYTRNGGFVAPRVHIKAVEEAVIEEFTQGVERVIRSANG